MSTDPSRHSNRPWLELALGAAVYLALALVAQYSFLLFHTMAELFSVAVAMGLFMVAWNTRQIQEDSFFMLLGSAYLAVGFIDVLHTLAYQGMGVFPQSGPNLATQLWISARYLEALSLLAAPFLAGHLVRAMGLVLAYALVSAGILWSIFQGWFPVCYQENQGLTEFKILSEYLICLILAVAMLLTWRQRDRLPAQTLGMVAASILVTIAAELCFTFYVSVYGFSNLVGHFLKITSFYLMYKALIATGLRRPYELLFRGLSETNRQLQAEVQQRLEAQRERDRTIAELQTALAEVKTLRGFIPICAGCRKVRDDQGYWQRVEVYISERTDAQFSHGLCPDCQRQLYPDLFPLEGGPLNPN